jgi:gamma-butyrobetaine dioxygenase
MRADRSNGQVAIGFSDGFAATVPEIWFDEKAEWKPAIDLPADITLWDSSLDPLPLGSFDTIRRSDAALATFLAALHTYGFAIARGVPTYLDGALDFASLIGPIRHTNWGGLADVKAIADAYDLTMTPRHLEPHSDNPYREPIPGYILLHCLRNDAEGGESTLVDGFYAAELLRVRDPAAFAALTGTRVSFRYEDRDTLLEHRGPLIEVDDGGRIVQVRYSNRTEFVEALPAAELDTYYRARRAFYQLINGDSTMTLTFKLKPGDLMMMDNFRLLHGRASYRLATGSRHMRQCYMDRDIVQSRRKILNRRTSMHATGDCGEHTEARG